MTDNSRAKAFVDKLSLAHMSPDELAHSGILGMHWGVRNSESVARESRQNRHARNTRRKLAVGTLGASVAAPKIAAAVKARRATITPNTKVHFKSSESGKVTKGKYPAGSSHDHVMTRELLTKKPHELSNADIQKIVDRLQKQQKLKQLNPSNVQRGKKITLGIVAGLGTAATVYNLVHSDAGREATARGAKIVAAILAKRA